jgi:glycerol kinase
VAIAGAAVQWLRDNLGIIREAKECGELAEQVSDTGDVYFVPAFSGLFAPHWREDARGVLTGLTQFTTKHHICRATLEAVAFQTRDILDAMRFDSTAVSAAGKAAGEGDSSVLKVDGGMCASRLLMQLQADLAGCRVRKPAMQETTALGAAIAAAIGINIYKLSADRHTLLPGDAWPVEFIKPDKLVFDDHTDYLPAISQEGMGYLLCNYY